MYALLWVQLYSWLAVAAEQRVGSYADVANNG